MNTFGPKAGFFREKEAASSRNTRHCEVRNLLKDLQIEEVRNAVAGPLCAGSMKRTVMQASAGQHQGSL